jgi:hypothetical protein
MQPRLILSGMPSALKLSDDLVSSARNEGRVASRSATQQVEHWARVGRMVERAGALDTRRLRAALQADLALDELAPRERLAVLGEMEALVFRPEGDADLRDRLLASATPKSGLDERGRLTSVDRQGRRTLIRDVNEYASKTKRKTRR